MFLFNGAYNAFLFTHTHTHTHTHIWLRTKEMMREETYCRNSMGYSFSLAVRDLLYALSH